MLNEAYIEKVMSLVEYEQLRQDPDLWYVEVPGPLFRGVWGSGMTRENAGKDFELSLLGWMELRQEHGLPTPAFEDF